jgi:hypothetical protein
MLRYKLRTLLIVLALGPVLIWGGCVVSEVIVTEIIRSVFPFPMYEPEASRFSGDGEAEA